MSFRFVLESWRMMILAENRKRSDISRFSSLARSDDSCIASILGEASPVMQWWYCCWQHRRKATLGDWTTVQNFNQPVNIDRAISPLALSYTPELFRHTSQSSKVLIHRRVQDSDEIWLETTLIRKGMELEDRIDDLARRTNLLAIRYNSSNLSCSVLNVLRFLVTSLS